MERGLKCTAQVKYFQSINKTQWKIFPGKLKFFKNNTMVIEDIYYFQIYCICTKTYLLARLGTTTNKPNNVTWIWNIKHWD